MTKSLINTLVAVSLGALLFAGVLRAAETDPVVARNSTAEVRLSEFRAEIEQRVPPGSRDEFLSSATRVGEIVSQILLRKTLAAEAKATKLDQQPANVARMRAEVERVLAQMQIAAIEEKAIADFDAKLPQQIARAREIYLAEQDRFRTPEEISASHILFDIRKHTSEDGRKLAEQARARIAGGADFATVAKEVSEDPSVASNGGALGWFTRDKMDPGFAEAAFALKQVGALSQPIQSRYGWHIVRLDGRRDGGVRAFDDVRDQIVGEMRSQYVEKQRESALAAIRNDRENSINEAALDEVVAKARAARPSGSTAAATGAATKP